MHWTLAYTIYGQFYNSVELSEKLLERKIHTVGTLHSFMGEPPEIRKPENLAKHGVLAKDDGKVVVIVWRDKRLVKAITTKHDDSMVTIQ